MFSSIGKLVYNPATHLSSSKNWIVLMCDDEISRYYCSLYEKQYFYKNGEYTGKIKRPVWGAHISVVRNEIYDLKNVNKKKQFFKFEYEPGVLDNKEYFWLKVYSDELVAFRKSLNLSSFPTFGFHLTIGRIN